jgi:hypothetical protein
MEAVGSCSSSAGSLVNSAPLLPMYGHDNTTGSTTAADGLNSPISLSSGYCSDDEAGELAAVRRGGDCWMPSTVVEQPPTSSTARMRRRHQRDRRQQGQQRVRRQHHQHRPPPGQLGVDLENCLDPFPVINVEDPFAVGDDGSRLPPLQVDPRLLDCDVDQDVIGCDVNDEVIVVSPTDGASDNSRNASSATMSFRLDDIVDSWLFNSVRPPSPGAGDFILQSDRRLAESSALSPRASDIDENTGEQSNRAQCSGSLLAELLLGLTVYRGAATHASRNPNVERLPPGGDFLKSQGNGASDFDNRHAVEKLISLPGMKSGDDFAVYPLTNNSIISSSPKHDRKPSCSDVPRTSTAVKRSHNGDVIASLSTDCSRSKPTVGKLLKLGTSCNSEMQILPRVDTSKPMQAVTTISTSNTSMSVDGELTDFCPFACN